MQEEYIVFLMAIFSICITIYECMYVKHIQEQQEEERYTD